MEIQVKCDRGSHLYQLDEYAVFTVESNEKETLQVEFSCDGEAVLSMQNVISPAKLAFRLSEPGFLRCTVRPASCSEPVVRCGVGFNPEQIRAVLPEPPDFDEFWIKARSKLAAIPQDCQLKYRPEFSTEEITLYNISFANVMGSRSYGFLSVPKTGGPFPLLVNIPGLGAGPVIGAWFRDWIIKNSFLCSSMVLMLHVHTYEPPDDYIEIQRIYKEYEKRIDNRHYYTDGMEQVDNCFLYRAILGALRAVEWVAQREDVDPARVVYYGASQGGDFGVYMTSLSKRITAAMIGVPCMGDLGGFLVGRHPSPAHVPQFREHLERLEYYDLVHFAGRIQCPVMMSTGFIDNSCAPSSVYPVYQALKGEKFMLAMPESGHSGDPKYLGMIWAWLREKLKV